MANFKTHTVTAALVSGTLATTFFVMGLLNDGEAVLMFSAGLIGGALPDIDSTQSIPIRIAFSIISIIIPFIVAFNQAYGDTLLEIMAIWFATFLLIRLVILRIIRNLMVHRGIIHSIPVAAIFGLLSVHLLYLFMAQSAYIAWMFGLFITLGFLVHLLLDEVYSVNLMNMQFKRSFGTALKLYDPNQLLLSLAAFGLAALLFYFAPSHAELSRILFNPQNWDHFLARLYPHDRWFSP